MTPTAPARTIEDITRDFAEAQEALAIAEREAADLAVEEARQNQSIGLVARGITLRAQGQRARRQETLELARARVKKLDALATQERERLAADRNRAAAERTKELRAIAAEITGRLGTCLAAFQADLDAFEHEIAAHNFEPGLSNLSRLRPPSDYRLIHAHLTDSINRLLTVYPPAAPKAKTITTED